MDDEHAFKSTKMLIGYMLDKRGIDHVLGYMAKILNIAQGLEDDQGQRMRTAMCVVETRLNALSEVLRERQEQDGQTYTAGIAEAVPTGFGGDRTPSS